MEKIDPGQGAITLVIIVFLAAFLGSQVQDPGAKQAFELLQALVIAAFSIIGIIKLAPLLQRR